jgi:hypothetical protein
MRGLEDSSLAPVCTVSVADDRSYIVLKYVGMINRELAAKFNLRAHALGHELGINHYLVDVTEARNTESTVGNYEFAYDDMHAAPFDRHAVVATVVSPDDHSHDFVEIVCRNAGLNVTHFRDRAAALEHLARQRGALRNEA